MSEEIHHCDDCELIGAEYELEVESEFTDKNGDVVYEYDKMYLCTPCYDNFDNYDNEEITSRIVLEERRIKKN